MKILFIVCMHGNETLGLVALKKLAKNNDVNFIIGNKRAMQKGQRFIETDLNRSFGAKNPKSFEEKLAVKMIKEIKRYDFIVDIHTTTAPTEKLVIVKKETEEVKKILNLIQFRRVAYMNRGIAEGSAINHHNGIAIEYSCATSLQEIMADLKAIIKNKSKKKTKRMNYEIFGLIKNLNFERINYIPVLVGEENYKDFLGFKARIKQ